MSSSWEVTFIDGVFQVLSWGGRGSHKRAVIAVWFMGFKQSLGEE